MVNNSEVQKSFQTLAQLLANNQLSVKTVNSEMNIDSVLQSIAVNADESGRIQGYLPSNILYDNGKFRDVNNKFTINPDGTFSSTDFVFQEGLIKNTTNTVLYDPNTKKLKYNKVTYDGVNNKLEENNKKFTIDNIGNLNAGENFKFENDKVSVGNLEYINNKVSVGNLKYDAAKQNEIIFGEDIMYDLNNKVIKKLDDSVIIDQEGKIMARKNDDGYDFIYDVTGDILARNDFVYKTSGEISARDLIYRPSGEISARDLIYRPSGEISARDLIYRPSGEISANDLIYQNNIVKNKDNIFEYNTTTKAFNADYLGKNTDGSNKYNFNMDTTGDVKVYPNATNIDHDVKYYKGQNIIEVKDINYNFNTKLIKTAGLNNILYDTTNNILKALPDSFDNYNFYMDKEVIQAGYNPTSNTYYFKSDGKTLNFKPNPNTPGTYEIVNDGTNTKIKDLIYDGTVLQNKDKTFIYDTNKNAVDIIGNNIIRYMLSKNGYLLSNDDGTYRLTQGTVRDISNNLDIPAVYTFNKFGELIDSPNFYDEVIIMKKAANVGTSGHLHIRKVFFYDINGYTGSNTGSLLMMSEISGLHGENMNLESVGTQTNGLLTMDNLFRATEFFPYWSGHGRPSVDNVIRIQFKKPIKLFSMRIDNRLNGLQNRIRGTVIYFRKNGNSLAKIDIDAPNITKDTTLNQFPLYNYNVNMFKNRGYTAPLHQPFTNNQDQWVVNPGSSMWRFFGTGINNGEFYDNIKQPYGFDWTKEKGDQQNPPNPLIYECRPWIALLVPTIAGTIDQRDDYK
jgi:hypothetical protein